MRLSARAATAAAALALVGGVAAAAPAHASDQRETNPWRFTTPAPADADARPGSYSITPATTLGGSRRGYSSTPADRITDR